MTNSVSRWMKFNLVGLIGVAVQISVLAALKSGAGLNYLTATVIAVETAILHNFVWHERWTWIERTRQSAGGLARRLFRFHLANGLISLVGNIALMWLLVSKLGLRYVWAGMLAIAACSLANFWASDRLVFRFEYRNVFFGFFLASAALQSPALYQDIGADSLIRSAMDATYMLRLPEARSASQELQRRYPDHPAGFLIESETYWWEAQEDPGNRKIEDAYYHAQEVAQGTAERAIQAGKYYKAELLAYMASAHASYARFQVTQKAAYFAALRAGLRAHEYAEQVYALDKSYYDIYVGLGAFNYFTGTLPAVIKPFAALLGARGDKNLGVEQLQTAIQRARNSRTEARIVYYTALLSNKEYPLAFPILDGLISDYPDNFVLYDWAEVWFREQNKIADGITYFEQAYQNQVKRAPLIAQYALLEEATLQLDAGLKPAANQTLQRIRTISGRDALLTKKIAALQKSAAP